jgi:hypothetical protein
VAAFQRVDPSVLVHDLPALLALTLTGIRFVGVSKVANDFALPAIGASVFCGDADQPPILESILGAGVVHRVIPVLEPLRGLDDYGLLAELHFFPHKNFNVKPSTKFRLNRVSGAQTT